MSITNHFRRPRHQPPAEVPGIPRWAPGWLMENQRSTIRWIGLALMGSLTVNGYQLYLREQIPQQKPEVWAALMSPDLTAVKVVNADSLGDTDFERLATARVKEFVYWLRRVETQRQVDEGTSMVSCSVTGPAADAAERDIRAQNFPLVEKGGTRFLSQADVHAGVAFGASREGETIKISAAWIEAEKVQGRNSVTTRNGEFLVQRFRNVSSKLKDCNIGGMMVVGYRIP